MRAQLLVAVSFTFALSAAADPAKPLEVKKAGAIDCDKTPNVRITHGSLKLTFKGTCTSMAVMGGNNEIVADAVVKLDIMGGHNRVLVARAETINLIGAKNVVTWGSTVDPEKTDVAVSYIGKDNLAQKGDKKAHDAAKPKAGAVVDTKKVNVDAKKVEEDAQKQIEDATKGLGIKIN